MHWQLEMIINVEIPNYWILIKLRDAGKIFAGGTPSTKMPHYWNGNIIWITPADLSGYSNKVIFQGAKTITDEGLKKSSARMIPKGSVLFSSRAPIGYVAIAGVELCTNQGFKSIAPNESVLNEFLYYYLKSSKRKVEQVASGTTFKEISLSKFSELDLPLPPLPEQRAIVAKIEQLFSELDSGVENLKKAQAQFKVYRQAVLKWAFVGKLTEEWRKKQKDLPFAETLLAQIKTEREKQAEKSNKKLKPIAPISEEKLAKLPKLPKWWCWMTPDILSTIDLNSICAGPFGTIFKAKDFRDSGIPIIFLRHVKAGQYKTDKPGFMYEKKWKELFIPYSVFGGELLITKLGDPPGECAIYPRGIGPAMVTPDIIKMSVNESFVFPKFLMYYFNSEVSRKISHSTAFGTTRLRVTIPIFRRSPIVYCSKKEQQQIVQEIEDRLSVCDKLEETIAQSLQKAESLRQSILKKAFEGKLLTKTELEEVRKAPDWEPAEKLLQRIKTEKESQKTRKIK